MGRLLFEDSWCSLWTCDNLQCLGCQEDVGCVRSSPPPPPPPPPPPLVPPPPCAPPTNPPRRPPPLPPNLNDFTEGGLGWGRVVQSPSVPQPPGPPPLHSDPHTPPLQLLTNETTQPADAGANIGAGAMDTPVVALSLGLLLVVLCTRFGRAWCTRLRSHARGGDVEAIPSTGACTCACTICTCISVHASTLPCAGRRCRGYSFNRCVYEDIDMNIHEHEMNMR